MFALRRFLLLTLLSLSLAIHAKETFQIVDKLQNKNYRDLMSISSLGTTIHVPQQQT